MSFLAFMASKEARSMFERQGFAVIGAARTY
jgi:hypothetical protein